MAAGLHGSARTTPRIRAELQASQEATRVLAARYSLNEKTVAKWRKRTTTTDQPMGPNRPRSTVLTEVEEAIIVEFRRRTLLPLDDVLGCLRESVPTLTRSALHRCLVRHGISRLPKDNANASKRGRFAETRIGYVPMDHCELRLAEGKLHMFLAIDRVSKFTHVAFFDAATQMNGAAFLREVIAAFPYAIHTVLTDNGMAFADLPKNRNGPTRRWLGAHIFDRVCREHGIEHRLTKPYHPWTNGQAERMNRTVKDATIKVFHYPDLESLKAHVLAFVTAYNFAKHLKRLRWRTPFQAVCDAWTKDPAPFKINPHHLIPGPHSEPVRGTTLSGRTSAGSWPMTCKGSPGRCRAGALQNGLPCCRSLCRPPRHGA
jgi:transposase InsO family protein